jgi:hypothetical protein
MPEPGARMGRAHAACRPPSSPHLPTAMLACTGHVPGGDRPRGRGTGAVQGCAAVKAGGRDNPEAHGEIPGCIGCPGVRVYGTLCMRMWAGTHGRMACECVCWGKGGRGVGVLSSLADPVSALSTLSPPPDSSCSPPCPPPAALLLRWPSRRRKGTSRGRSRRCGSTWTSGRETWRRGRRRQSCICR